MSSPDNPTPAHDDLRGPFVARVWFDPDSIRNHFEGDASPVAEWLLDEPDDVLASIGTTARDAFETDDRLWELFGECVRSAGRSAYNAQRGDADGPAEAGS